MAKNILFDFQSLSQKDKSVVKIKSTFTRAGAKAISVNIGDKIKRMASVKYKEIHLAFDDSQNVVFCIKETGDIFQVLLNQKAVPIKNQEDHVKAIGEIVQAMERGRQQFQRKLANIKPKLQSGMKSTVPKLQESLKDRKQALLEAIAEAEKKLAEIRKVA